MIVLSNKGCRNCLRSCRNPLGPAGILLTLQEPYQIVQELACILAGTWQIMQEHSQIVQELACIPAGTWQIVQDPSQIVQEPSQI